MSERKGQQIFDAEQIGMYKMYDFWKYSEKGVENHEKCKDKENQT